MSWVQQVRRTEHSLIAVLSQDADLTVEALSNLPADARGRLQTILALAEETAAQAASGTMVVVDTGLGTAQYHLLESGEESSATDDQPRPRHWRGSAFSSLGRPAGHLGRLFAVFLQGFL